ncbi:MAG TPA: hypothetical protein VMH85_12005 [Terriglobales bacterium]|nr:hypothetical protein [Terriglobales bacterium]
MSSAEESRLAREIELYTLHRADWFREHPGQYVVIKDGTVLDFYPNFEAAYRAGATAWGLNTDFLVKQILEHEPVFFVF